MKQQFDWHTRKAETNRRDHGVTFEQGAKAIADPFAVEWIDDREDYAKSASICSACAKALSCM